MVSYGLKCSQGMVLGNASTQFHFQLLETLLCILQFLHSMKVYIHCFIFTAHYVWIVVTHFLHAGRWAGGRAGRKAGRQADQFYGTHLPNSCLFVNVFCHV